MSQHNRRKNVRDNCFETADPATSPANAQVGPPPLMLPDAESRYYHHHPGINHLLQHLPTHQPSPPP
ncbi:hypothetical protein Q8A67_020730 [Cirrhinus molitorella]|uniref:Uncharacterized protein n=1 Tax=Cirrhinus molitorella TaxID=172907 RepID=A0AA88TE93_9TELE|nr:hypothetical protein Q8A67_020730 [Cirrhinus molitorella]